MRARFGPFTVDTDTRQLLREAASCTSRPRPSTCSAALIEQRPKVIDKADLHARLWPDTYVVDGNLNVLVAEIRRVLADDARQPRFIRTVHGVGYAFCGDGRRRRGAAGRPMPCWLATGSADVPPPEGDSSSAAIRIARSGSTRRACRGGTPASSSRATRGGCGSRTWTARTARSSGDLAVRGRIEVADGDALTFGSVEVTLHSWNEATAAETRRIARKRR